MPLGSSSLSSFLPNGPSVTRRSVTLSGRMNGRSNTSNSLMPMGPNLEFDGAELQRLQLLLVLVEGGIGVDLDLHLAVRILLGQFLELERAFALRRVLSDHVAELDHDGLLRLGGPHQRQRGSGGSCKNPVLHDVSSGLGRAARRPRREPADGGTIAPNPPPGKPHG